ncbi:winged helix-turn-helix transcriptional regulator [Streptomonospora sp. PA3]|uniref:ArsR/SmtB family transcription factor n=1 Tax=Streptomonospora sp. PA3 TaxID=2607326 RepID=UPI0012DE4BE5|nr:metalloregulator ArsR/SmtB family transcription factor [Streptomonospora sp. PA3]MUL44295.1 winged helix-turn-helix transcriptional regulator [Streptomonospora sp. PA3]
MSESAGVQGCEGLASDAACGAEGSAELSEATHDFLKALASPTRQRIMLLFAQGAELSVGEVAERIGIGQSTASQQLALLRRGGILASRREGKIVLYRSDRERSLAALDDLRTYLRYCC